MRWFDTHVHLERYPAAERGRMLREAAEVGVERMLAVSTSCGSSRRSAGLSEDVLKAVGVHPARAAEGVCPEMQELARAGGVAAIGETGFDASGPAWEAQEAAFREQAELARRLGLAVVLHIDGEGAWEHFAAASEAVEGLCVIRHYFGGDGGQARWHAERGQFISFGRPLLRDAPLREVARGLSAELLLIETDSYPLPGRTTEPKDLPPVAEALAEIRGWTLEQCSERLWENSCRALGLAG